MLNSNLVGFVFLGCVRFPLSVYAMLFSVRSLDGSLGGTMNGIFAHITSSRFWGGSLLWFSGMERIRKGREMKGTVWTSDHVW